MEQEPVVLVAHASWHRPLHYRPLIRDLREKGFIVLVPPLPTAAYDDSVIGKSVTDDVAHLHEYLIPYLDAGRDGGRPGADGGGANGRRAPGGGVLNMSLLDAAGGEWRGTEWYGVKEHTIELKSPISEDTCYADLPGEVKREAAKYRCSQSVSLYVDVIPYASQDVPINKTYLICTQDQTIVPAVQQF
ncbi:hypothetical protein N7492_002716 [Penicillium capsulatum]|uniref:Uncharacterized protein n=1 Tax=Penicillium capsulatum TaxID=69766 RepID=A0A9W9IPL6_9EURO|nr:hypothetical protein N7492_002716 [Penicillium capsulatum]KAJ6122687.1 hypothetical protein N7512_005152 [Penicillium capsulatum]